MSWRAIRRAALRDAHNVVRVAAVYLPSPSATPIPCSVRIHNRPTVVEGDDASMLDATPYVVFDRMEIPNPLGRAVVVISEDEAYRLGVSRPTNHEFQRIEAVILSGEEAAAVWNPAWAGSYLPVSPYRVHKQTMHRDLHNQMRVPALYITSPSAAPITCSVRIQNRPTVAEGEDAAMLDATPHVVFDRLEISNPLGRAVVVISEDEVYRLGVSHPTTNQEFLQVEAVILNAEEAAAVWNPAWGDGTQLPVAPYRVQKRTMHREVHTQMRVRALYLTSITAIPIGVYVRVHVDVDPLPGLADSQFIDTTPHIIFDQAEVPRPLPLAYVIVSTAEMYHVGPSRAPRNGFIGVEVRRLMAAEMLALLAALGDTGGDFNADFSNDFHVSDLDPIWEEVL